MPFEAMIVTLSRPAFAAFAQDYRITGRFHDCLDRLKERLFGLTNSQGNHGEDVKEHWWHLDATPTHSYARSLYRYPQAAFPYADLVATNAERSVDEEEYELADTGVLAIRRWPAECAVLDDDAV